MSQTIVKWLDKKQFVGIDSSRHSVVMSSQDAENAVGCKPSDLLPLALGSCVAVDVVEILAKQRTPLASLEIVIDSQQDPAPPWAFRRIHLTFRVAGAGLTPRAVERAIRLAEGKYCSVADTIRAVTKITLDFELDGAVYACPGEAAEAVPA
ncbi:MAG: OsmC family protein [Anaerolineales bacterium]|nr:OsmC family protein [Anaerolineales bacterium]